MTVTRVPASNPEPEVPITDPRWLVSTQPDPAPGIDGGLDGRGTTHAADLPATAHTWGHLSVSLETDTDLDADVPVTRSLCLLVDPEGDYLMPGRCKKPLGHEEPHDWGANHGAFLGETRRAELRDTPSGRLPVRTPGAALRDEEGSDGPGGPGESARPGESILGRRVIERWPA